jgi:phenylalanyl-tRNA synthetase beta chain
MRNFLTVAGLTEAVNLTFASAEMNLHFGKAWPGQASPVSILNPLVQESSEMRLSLMPGLVSNLRAHAAQKVRSFWVFELGRVFWHESEGQTGQRQRVGALFYGPREQKGLRATPRNVTFLDLKGMIEDMLELMGLDSGVAWVENEAASFLHPGKSAAVLRQESLVGIAGEIHPDLAERLGVPSFLAFELDFEGLVQYARSGLTVRFLPRFPSVERDLAIVVEESFPAQRVIRWIRDLSHALIEDVKVFDEYRGSQITQGKKSLAYKISYRAEDRTLTDAEVNEIHQSLIAQLLTKFAAEVRA